ncbi:peptidoglycan-binding protein [Grosmannia clavigera kw1407]|uniref:Peptidoglycan-binding protein n=1 Tax=Grosmannia clavigera (strain kw1407 / UAMH 11150) TaxID=655863 RepID=F0XAS5_GROCL|nr:peptidoglycan-binding protein [Grosmannia clavigera kw1407]EFX05908.1 peptidoglycan-binding protein [Grosmannia clavigera kw1407]
MVWFSQVQAFSLAFLTQQVTAQSNLYPEVDSERLASALNISGSCLEALNMTVDCDQTLLSMAGSVDDYLWDVDNVTTLCTSDCLSSSQTWFSTVYDSCSSDVLVFLGKQVPAYTIPGRTLDGLNIACLAPTTNVSADPGVAASIVTYTNVTSNGTDDSDDSSSLETQQSATVSLSSSGYCLIDSYNWVGSDIIRPDCSLASNENNSQCIDPTDVSAENERLANLYSNDILCDACFVNMFFLRLASSYLPDTDYSDHLILQYYDILETCNITGMPELIIREDPDYLDAPGYVDGMLTNTSSLQPFPDSISINVLPNSAASLNSTCAGQSLTYSQVSGVADAVADADLTSFCDALSVAFNVSTGDLYQAFQNIGCDVASSNATNITWCLPEGCSVYQSPDNSSCTAAVQSVSTAEHNITVQQLVQYNPNLQGTCDQLEQQYLCITPPGGAYVPPPTNVSSTGAGEQQRGGGDGGSTRNQTITTGNPTVKVSPGGTPPSPTQLGINADCVVYSNASVGDTCDEFAEEHDINPADLFAWNKVLGTDGAYCTTEFWSGYWYSRQCPQCPSPTQSGIVSSCDQYAQAASGDTCSSFAADHDITASDLYQWNKQLGTDGTNCSTEFWAGYYYCINAGMVPSNSVSSPVSATSTSSSSTPAPTPTQSGIVSNCKKYAEVSSGDTCSSFASANDITEVDLYTWNTQLGVDGEDCSTELWSGYYYCVSI